jgi:hypothetical protein
MSFVIFSRLIESGAMEEMRTYMKKRKVRRLEQELGLDEGEMRMWVKKRKVRRLEQELGLDEGEMRMWVKKRKVTSAY